MLYFENAQLHSDVIHYFLSSFANLKTGNLIFKISTHEMLSKTSKELLMSNPETI